MDFKVKVKKTIYNWSKYFTATSKQFPWMIVETFSKKKMSKILPQILWEFMKLKYNNKYRNKRLKTAKHK